MGLATAWALKRRGYEPVVYEQFAVGHDRGSSHGRSRIFRLAYAEDHYVRLAQEALTLWRELEAESGETVLPRDGGGMREDASHFHDHSGRQSKKRGP